MPDVVLIRAGSTDFDAQQRIQGSLDLPLNERGVEEVGELIEELRDDEISVIFTPRAEPALSTATAIGEGLGGVRVRESNELRNLNQGLWEGLQADDVRRKYPRLVKQWREAPETICPPEGETLTEVRQRVRKALEKPLKKSGSIAIVASEPLATILGCILERRRPEITACLCGDDSAAPVTRLHIEEQDVADVWSAPSDEADGTNGHAAPRNGKHRNGKHSSNGNGNGNGSSAQARKTS